MLRVAEHVERSDTGRQRRANEDSFFARAPLFVVADGMGGAQAGEVASQTAVSAFEEDLELGDGRGPDEVLSARVHDANAAIHQLSRTRPELAGMGTTLTALYIGPEWITIAHVGDSRAYLLREGALTKLTEDHSLVDELVKRGELTPEEAEDHPQRSVITRALGPEPIVDVDNPRLRGHDGDVLLLCSDGLTSMVSPAQVEAIMLGHDDLEEMASALVAAANAAGGKDNITVVLVRLEELAGPAGGGEPSQPTIIQRAVARPEGEEELGGVATIIPESRGSRAQAPPPRQPRPPEPAARRRRRRPRGLVGGLIILGTLLVVLTGAYLASQEVYFLGTDQDGLVTIYQGLPYALPLGLRLYSIDYESGVPALALSPPRRHELLNHSLRSHDDAANLVRQLELGRIQGGG
ncbi:MAG TPA: Stp1/IreP family PP2C-type Ser/Thr phosphatase [Solirubrobacteraceae bacterium]|jgi:protein phosphatase|nr:Stp1/IreP family PP2C-type Ser/Thr phosphatase [Solirubrobacteraceae bacterium]